MVINSPQVYKDKWLVFEKTVPTPLEFVDCNDTVTGSCLTNLNFDECLDVCSGNCNFGYYVEVDDTPICVAVNSDISRIENPTFILKNQDYYNFNDNVNITYFQNKKFPYPPENSAEVFHTGLMQLFSYYDKDYGLYTDIEKIEQPVYLSKEKQTILTILPVLSYNTNLLKYEALTYGEYVNIVIPNTTLQLTYNINGDLKFEINTITINKDIKTLNTYFYLEPIDKNDTGKNVKWNKPFIIRTINNGVLFINNHKTIGVSYEDILKIPPENIYFKLNPYMKISYCDLGICKSEIFNEKLIIQDDNSNSLKILDSSKNPVNVYFQNKCWNTCNNSDNTITTMEQEQNQEQNQEQVKIWLSIIFLLISVIVIILIIFKIK